MKTYRIRNTYCCAFGTVVFTDSTREGAFLKAINFIRG
jgi:hypothetical protein